MALNVDNLNDAASVTWSVPSNPLTIAFWYKPNAPDDSSSPFSWDGGSLRMTWNYFADIQRLRLSMGTASEFFQDSALVGISSGVWYLNALVNASTTDHRLYGGVLGSGTQSKVTGTNSGSLDGTTLRYPASSVASKGDYGPLTIWSAALTDEEIQSLIRGFSGRLIRPGSILRHYEVTGNLNPEPDIKGNTGLSLTSTAKGDHPRIIYPD